MKIIFAVLLSFSLLGFSSMTAAAEATVVNQVLFELNQEAFTSYDFQQFLKAKKTVSLDVGFLKAPKDDNELFLLTRILFYQLTSSMDASETEASNSIKKYQAQNDSLNAEIERLKLIVQNNDAQFQHLALKDKYELWLGYMKKKYNYTLQYTVQYPAQ